MFAAATLRPMGNSLRVLAALLAYPDARLREHFAEMRALLAADDAVPRSRREELDALTVTLERADPMETEGGTASSRSFKNRVQENARCSSSWLVNATSRGSVLRRSSARSTPARAASSMKCRFR